MSRKKKKKRYEPYPFPELDLHRIKHSDVRPLVIRFIEKHWDSDQTVQIITGNSSEMKRIVSAVLDEYQLDYCSGNPLNPNNDGVIRTTL